MNPRLAAALCASMLAAPLIGHAEEAKAPVAESDPARAAKVEPARSARLEVAPAKAEARPAAAGAQAAVASDTSATAPPPSEKDSAAAAPSTSGVVPAAANEPTTVIGPLPVKPASAAPDALPPDPGAVPGVNAADQEPESLIGTLFRTFLVLGIVVVLIYVSLNYGLRKLMGVRGMPMGRSSLVKVIERIPLDPRRTLFIIQAGGEYLLVGGGDEGLSLISKLDPAEVTRALEQRNAPTGAPSAFLQKLLSRGAAPAAQPPASGTPPPNPARSSGEIDKV